MKTIALLGSTGSIGRQTLDVVRAFPGEFRVVALAAGSNIDLLMKQVEEFGPGAVSSPSLGKHPEAMRKLSSLRVDVCSLEEMAGLSGVDLVVVATSGKAGLAPTLAALRSGKPVALANKEVLVMAGQLVREEADRRGLPILPVDSEHSALWQCLRGEGSTVSRLILTASGGPFRNCSRSGLANVTARDALNHPTWQMGPKVTID
ncbi:MAG: 1-deoxy-D-xylulose-5-phosphate reductoisomerase, partial [Dehalococcoidia bacterium]|nr:1-deoxy-D-xylulose-5-phosphate reductoisomerase [Dehalococcoidia bacterium]